LRFSISCRITDLFASRTNISGISFREKKRKIIYVSLAAVGAVVVAPVPVVVMPGCYNCTFKKPITMKHYYSLAQNLLLIQFHKHAI